MFANEQVESLVIGRLLIEPSLLNQEAISGNYFTNFINKTIFMAIEETKEILRDGDDLNNINQIAACMEGRNHLDHVGGLVKLTEFHPAIGETFFYNLKELRKLFRSRMLLKVLQETIGKLQHEEIEAEEAIDSMLPHFKMYGEIEEDGRTLKDSVKDEIISIFDFIEARKKGQEPLVGIPTGINTLDAIIGGMPVGVPTVIAARPGEGKSTLALNIANNVAKRGIGVHLFSYEDGEKSFSQRMIAMRTNNDLSKIVHRKIDDTEQLRIRTMKGTALENIRVEKAHGYNAKKITRSYKANRLQLNTKLVIVDYLQLMPGENRQAPTHEQLERNMQELAAMAAQEEIAVMILSQLKRETQGIEPKLNDLRGSGAIEQIGKLIIALHADSPESTQLKFVILKNFQGKRGYMFGDYNRGECLIR